MCDKWFCGWSNKYAPSFKRACIIESVDSISRDFCYNTQAHMTIPFHILIISIYVCAYRGGRTTSRVTHIMPSQQKVSHSVLANRKSRSTNLKFARRLV